MFYKLFSITLLLSCNTIMHASQEDDYSLATTPVSKEAALPELLQTGYPVEEKDLVFKGNPDTGANFVDAIIPQTNPVTGETIEIRTVYYQPGGQVGDHTHDETEKFHVTRGWVKVFLLEQNKKGRYRWTTSVKHVGDDINIPAHTRHALIAGKEGLCMHIARNDNTRSVNFTKTSVQPWENQSQPFTDGYDLETFFEQDQN